MEKQPLNKSKEPFDYTLIETQWGEYLAVASEQGLCWLMKCRLKKKPPMEILSDYFPLASLQKNDKNNALQTTRKVFSDFIAGKKVNIDSLPLDLRGTEFQRKAWATIAAIPDGETISYKDVAKGAGNENAVRAAGSACGKNPIPYFIPCHRVIGHNGNLGGFTWGLDEKRYLLKRENEAAWPAEWSKPYAMVS